VSFNANSNTLTTTPLIYPENIITKATTAGVTLFFARFTSGALGRTSLPAGTWEATTFVATSTLAGSNVISASIRKRVVQTGITGTFTGAGPTRTFTVTGGAPFVAGDANADIRLSSVIETTSQTAWITAFTSSTVVTVTLTDPAFVNTTNVPLNAIHYYLLQGQIPALTATAVTEYNGSSARPDFPLTVTDAIVAEYFATTSVGKNISLYFGGTDHFSYFCSPIVLLSQVTADNGTATPDVNANYNFFGASGAYTDASASTVTNYAPKYEEISLPGTLARNHGYFSTASNTYTLPTASLIVGDEVHVTPVIGSGSAQIDAGAGQSIRNGGVTSASITVNEGYCAVLRYRAVDLTWYATVFQVPVGGFNWSDQVAAYTAAASNGYFIIGNLTATLPAAPANGDTISWFVDGAFTVTIQATGAQTIKAASGTSAAAGSLVNTADGDSITLVYRSTNNRWCAIDQIGNWTIN
jgi:hypothetical protein